MTGALAATQYYSPPAITVRLTNQSLSKRSLATATATYTINSNGNVVGPSGATLEAWLIGVGAVSSSYEVMATQTAGDSVDGTLGSWLNCGTSRAWSISNSARDNSVLTGVITVQIRDVATHTAQATASITLSAESDSL